MEEKKDVVEYRDTVNLTYISNITQLERQLQAIEMSYMTDKGVLEPLDAIVLTNGAGVGVGVGGGNGAVVGVIDDRDVIEDRPHERPGVTRLKSVTRGVYRMVKSDVGLVLLLVCYMAMGAAIFTAIEERSPEEMEQAELEELRQILADIRSRIDPPYDTESPADMVLQLDVGTGNTTSGPPEGNATRDSVYGDLVVANDIQNQLVDAVVRCHEYHEREEGRKPPPKKQMLWTFSGAMYFCVTVFTTVGYGNIVPTTDRSRVVTMIYAAIGIPLCLVVLSQVGKSLTRLIKFHWSFVRRFYYTGSCQRVRRMIPLSRFRRSLFQRVSDHVRQSTVRLTSRRRGLSSSSSTRGVESSFDDRQGLNEIYIPYEVDDKFNLPPIVAILIAFLYIFLGAFLYTRWEDWTYLEAFYFTFISLCTIGFGDVVPDHPKFFLASSVYLLLGLALAAMVINVIMEAVTDTITMATDTVRHVRRRIVHLVPHAQCLAIPPRESLDLTSRRRSV